MAVDKNPVKSPFEINGGTVPYRHIQPRKDGTQNDGADNASLLVMQIKKLQDKRRVCGKRIIFSLPATIF